MKPTIPTHNPDTIRWFIVGAYQAGASESEITALTSLPKFFVHNTVSSFKKTGNPTMKKQKSKKRTTKMDSLPYENLADTKGDKRMDAGIQEINQFKGRLHQNRSPSIKPKRKPTATDAIDYILNKGRLYEEKRISSRWKSQKQQGYRSDNIEPSSPPRLYDPISPIPTTDTVDLQPSNPSIGKVSPSSPSQTLLSSHDHRHNNSTHKINFWSRKDDKILLKHVLTRMGCWNELDQLFDGRHSDVDCKQRWNILQHYLFKQLKKNETNGW